MYLKKQRFKDSHTFAAIVGLAVARRDQSKLGRRLDLPRRHHHRRRRPVGETGWSVLRRAAKRMHNRIFRVQGAIRAFRADRSCCEDRTQMKNIMREPHDWVKYFHGLSKHQRIKSSAPRRADDGSKNGSKKTTVIAYICRSHGSD